MNEADDNDEAMLSFVPQKKLVYNELLPYSENLDLESRTYLSCIKGNLGNSILKHDIVPGCMTWTNNLINYIRLYGRNFSKEDHLSLIKLLYELLIIPNLELNVVVRVAHALNLLLKKRDLLSREDLELPWRPLYNLYEVTLHSTYEHLGMLLLPANLESTLKTLIRSSRVYFSAEATQEMLDEWHLLMCPYDVTMAKAMTYFDLFLPTCLPPELHHKGFKLWFKEFMDIWETSHNGPSWENNLIWLFSRLARDTIGYIEWEPYIPVVFTRLLRSFNLPGAHDKIQVIRASNSVEINAIVGWISAMLGNNSSCQKNITRLFKALESYYHPSNTGRWMVRLQRLLYKLPVYVVKRLNRERYRKTTWETPIPSTHKLTDNDITEFVESIKHVVMLSMFSKSGSADCAVALQNLSILRPELVIPPVLERLYSSLETLTEPHRLTAAMHCVVSVSRALVQPSKFYPEGRLHVIPLLMGSLPGIDPNDIKKCMVTFQFISTFTALIPLIDCSKLVHMHPELTEQEQELCLATVEFEDFVLQFMDRCFVVIENSSLEHPTRLDRETERMNIEENFLKLGVSSTFSGILTQCSPKIYEAALRKLHSFVSSHILETKVAGKFAANMCRFATRVNAELALQVFIPHFGKSVLSLVTSEDFAKHEENLDDELLFGLLLLSEVVRCDGKYLLNHSSILMKVLNETLHLTCRQGYLLSCALLRHILRSLTTIYPIDFRSVTIPWDQWESENYLPINDWGKPGDIKQLSLKWHTPSEEELDFAQSLLKSFLYPELQLLSKWQNSEQDLSREELQRSLNIVLDCLQGALAALPLWPIEEVKLINSSVPLYYTRSHLSIFGEITFEKGKNTREEIVLIIMKVLAHIIETCEDDTKSLFLIMKIYESLLFHWGVTNDDFTGRWRGFQVVKKALENKLTGRKQHIRALLVDRAYLQHEMHVLGRKKTVFTTVHRDVMQDLLQLATSKYSQVRSRAQDILQNIIRQFACSYKTILPNLCSLLQKDPIDHHEQFKGALYVLYGQKQNTLLTTHCWETLGTIWPLMVSSKHSEKISIIKLLDNIADSIQKHMISIQIRLQIPKSCIEQTKLLWTSSAPNPSKPMASQDEIDESSKQLEMKCEDNVRNYRLLIDKLVDLLENGNLHWRHYHLGLILLNVLIRHDILLPSGAVKLFVKHLIHDTLFIRKISVGAVCAILKQQKKFHVKQEFDLSNVNTSNLPVHPVFQDISDKLPINFWLQYNSLVQPKTKDLWNQYTFVHKSHIGFYNCSRSLEVYCHPCQQPNLDRKLEELSEEEIGIFESFSQKAFIEKLISFHSLEERKGHDKFDAKRFYLFKSLFRNFGDTFLPLLEDYLKKQVADPQESVQRCASEIIAGLIRGSKHWDFEKTMSLKNCLQPILRTALNNITSETLPDWGICIATSSESRDPNKYYWLFELLMEEPLKEESGSFLESSWMYVLLGALAQQEWRVCELLHRTLAYLKPRLSHSYQNVREKLGSLLSNIFMYDIAMPLSGECHKLVPKRSSFITYIVPQLSLLQNSRPTSPIQEGSDNSKPINTDILQNNHFHDDNSERKTACNLLRTVCRWLMTSLARSLHAATPEVFSLLAVLCHMQSDTTDEGMQRECIVTIAILGQAFLLPDSINAAIGAVKQICNNSSSWHARGSALHFLQLMVFSNLFVVLNNQIWVQEITELVLKLLQDERLEVREAAAETLGGLMHCEFIKITDKLLNEFKSRCKSRLMKKRTKPHERASGFVIESNELIERHAGILGLCSCVNSFPYDVPEFLPDILMILGDHLSDPQPIPTTIKKTLSNFRRTHHDNWRDHKLKFTDDQLAVITDLLVSPSYYA